MTRIRPPNALRLLPSAMTVTAVCFGLTALVYQKRVT